MNVLKDTSECSTGVPVFFVHTHAIPLPLRAVVGGAVIAIEQDPSRCERYYGRRPTDPSVAAFVDRWPDLLGELQVSKEFRWVLAIEGIPNTQGFIHELRSLRAKGLRVLQPCHWPPYQPYAEASRLTAFGKELLRHMQDIEMVLDVSHMSGPLLMDTLEEFGGQIVASHVVLKDALATKMPRANCLSRDEILCLASRSALIGLPFVNDLLSFTTPGPDGKYSTGIHDLMRQFAAILDLVGPEQLALGADFFDFDHYSARLGVQLGVVGALDTEAGIRNLRKQLINLGLSAEDVTGIMWSNALQFFDTTLLEGAGHASSRGSGGQQLSTRAGSVWSFQDTGNAEVVAACKSCDMAAPAPPSHAWIALNNYCNLACKHCRRTYGRIPGDTVSRDIPDILYDRITSELLPGLQSLILGGNNTSEITTAKRFPDIVKWLSNSHNRPLRISVQTNGAIMGDEQMERLVVMDTVFNISIEGGTNTTCKRIRGISLDALRTRLTRINRARIQHGSKARIVLSFTAMKSNIDELPSLVEFAERCGVDEVNVMYLLPATEQWNAESPVNAIEHNNDVIESTMRLAEAWHVELVAPPIRDINDQPCMRPWYSMSVNGNGGIHFCCLEGSPEIGNLVRQDVSEAWNSDAARQARLSVNSLRPPLECGSCVLRNLPFVSTRALRKQMA